MTDNINDAETDPLVQQDHSAGESKGLKAADQESSGGSYFSARHLSKEDK